MTDLYLKFKDEAEAVFVLYEITPATDTEEAVLKPKYRNIDTLGILYEKQEVIDQENPPTPIPLDGWHVNVRVVGEDATPLEPFKVNPKPQHWRRVWG